MNEADKVQKLQEKHERARVFQEKLAATGLRLLQFAKEAGFTRNVIYNLSIGQKPTSEEQAKRLEEAFERLRRDKRN